MDPTARSRRSEGSTARTAKLKPAEAVDDEEEEESEEESSEDEEEEVEEPEEEEPAYTFDKRPPGASGGFGASVPLVV